MLFFYLSYFFIQTLIGIKIFLNILYSNIRELYRGKQLALLYYRKYIKYGLRLEQHAVFKIFTLSLQGAARLKTGSFLHFPRYPQSV